MGRAVQGAPKMAAQAAVMTRLTTRGRRRGSLILRHIRGREKRLISAAWHAVNEALRVLTRDIAATWEGYYIQTYVVIQWIKQINFHLMTRLTPHGRLRGGSLSLRRAHIRGKSWTLESPLQHECKSLTCRQ